MDKRKEEIAKESLKALNEIEETVNLDNIVKDNKIVFKIKEKTYRIRKPNIIEQEEVNKIRRKKHLEYVKDKDMLFRKQWIDIYKQKGIDLHKMDLDVKQLQNEIKALLLRLYKLEDKNSIDAIKKEIEQKRFKQYEISMEKTDLLSHSIEDQLLVYVNSYVTYLVLEEQQEDKWVKVFKDYEEFRNADNTELLNKAFYYINYLIYQYELRDIND